MNTSLSIFLPFLFICFFSRDEYKKKLVAGFTTSSKNLSYQNHLQTLNSMEHAGHEHKDPVVPDI